VEIKNLRDQLSTRQQQVMPTVYPGISSMISNIVESNNNSISYNLSEPFQIDDLEIIGYRVMYVKGAYLFTHSRYIITKMDKLEILK
jgi:hypothetical protein